MVPKCYLAMVIQEAGSSSSDDTAYGVLGFLIMAAVVGVVVWLVVRKAKSRQGAKNLGIGLSTPVAQPPKPVPQQFNVPRPPQPVVPPPPAPPPAPIMPPVPQPDWQSAAPPRDVIHRSHGVESGVIDIGKVAIEKPEPAAQRDRRPAVGHGGGAEQEVPSHPGGEIFISYASSDRPAAARLAKALQEEGWSVWWDRSIPPGKTFDEVIEAALGAAKCVVVLWSEHSVASDWVKVECAEAARHRILIPAMITEVAIPLEFRRLQAASLVDWPGEDPHPGFESLAASIAGLLGKPRGSRRSF